MKSVRSSLWLVLIALATVAFAQSDGQKSFDKMKSLAGDWEGSVTMTPPMPEMDNGKPVRISMRITSRGNAIVHEMQEAGTVLDATKYDHPVTMFYLDSDRLRASSDFLR